jgi:hypothetical protein
MTSQEDETTTFSSIHFDSASLRHLLHHILKEKLSSQPFHQAFHAAGVASAEDLLYFSLEDWKNFSWTKIVKAEEDDQGKIEKVHNRLNFTQLLKLDALRMWHVRNWKAGCGKDPDEFFGTLTYSAFVAFRAESNKNTAAIAFPFEGSSATMNSDAINIQASGRTKRRRNASENVSLGTDGGGSSLSNVARKCSRRKPQKSTQNECIVIEEDDSDQDTEIEFLGTSTPLITSNGTSGSFWDSPTSYQLSGGMEGKRSRENAAEDRKMLAVRSYPQSKSRGCPTAQTSDMVETIDADAPANELLQKLLRHIGCRYELLSHQYEGVRKTAGLGIRYPKDVVGLIKQSSNHITWNDVICKSRLTKLRGILMADVMGLGKVNAMHASHCNDSI